MSTNLDRAITALPRSRGTADRLAIKSSLLSAGPPCADSVTGGEPRVALRAKEVERSSHARKPK